MLVAWWATSAAGEPGLDAEYELGFGPGYDWRGVVRAYEPDREIEWELTRADSDWLGTRMGILIEARDGASWIRLHHTGWPEDNDHYRISCFCWAMYLRLLERHVETGEFVEYERRLDV